jgi:hypothetical protein
MREEQALRSDKELFKIAKSGEFSFQTQKYGTSV